MSDLSDKDWLAEVGAERLEEARDPDLAYSRAIFRSYVAYREQGVPHEETMSKIEALCFEIKNHDKGNVVDISSVRRAQSDKKMTDYLKALLGPLE